MANPVCHCGRMMVKNGTRAGGKQRYTCRPCHTSIIVSITPNYNTLESLDSRMDVASVWKSNGSYQMVIPKKIAAKAGLDQPCMVAVESVDNGILIKKLEVV